MRHYLRYLTLSTPRQRLVTWFVLSVCIYFVNVRWLENLSLYKRVGLEGAPSIGLTRAYRHLLHGDFAAAWEMNRIIFVVVIAGGAVLLVDVWRIIKDSRR